MAVYERTLRLAIARPMALTVLSLLVLVAAYGSYRLLGSDLLPEMDEGGFILDYIMPAGSSLAETNQVLTGVEQILRATPEVESTSRRTGLQLGLAAVTEANTGDISVKLKRSRDRGSDEVISAVRDRVTKRYPMLDVEFVQLTQDMIGDLTSAPEPIAIKLFSQDPALLKQWAPQVGEAIKKLPGVVDVLDGIENTISGPATLFKVDQAMAARAGFTPQELETNIAAIMQGEPAPTPVVLNDRAYTIRVRFPGVDANLGRGDQEHAAGQRHRPHRHARDAVRRGRHPGTDRGAAREPAAQRHRHRAARRASIWGRAWRRRSGRSPTCTCRRRSASPTAAPTRSSSSRSRICCWCWCSRWCWCSPCCCSNSAISRRRRR